MRFSIFNFRFSILPPTVAKLIAKSPCETSENGVNENRWKSILHVFLFMLALFLAIFIGLVLMYALVTFLWWFNGGLDL